MLPGLPTVVACVAAWIKRAIHRASLEVKVYTPTSVKIVPATVEKKKQTVKGLSHPHLPMGIVVVHLLFHNFIKVQ
nr:hypothetical protein Iba_chr03aCG21990 [Ipomoea batatas]